MKKDQIKRAGDVLIILAISAGIILAFPILFIITGVGIPCPFKFLTGLDCPGCGATRMMIALAHLDIPTAARMNFGVLISAPIWLLSIIRTSYRYIRHNIRQIEPWVAIALLCTLIWYILFGILRNLDFFAYLFKI